ncbi:MAG: AAA family ATPase [Candidatus Kerfeldbacteria bacterium]|nr:AAA family ATPase [Candidatus Kerfeldbacteria bacterium]
MFLQKIEIQGFKSFANKTILEFNRELTAIVGPNGSGKSNVADAVRWVLGEQSLKLLRGKKAEDVIFAGSDKKNRSGMAEVSIYLNNEDGQAPIEYSELIITRRVFRDGQSEYLLNQNQVRLQDIQLLMARASVGQKTYSVIAQGMIDSVLLASPGERKEFFEEATGVKQYQIKREQSINKLVTTYENLEQAKILVQEIEPRLRVLTRQIKRLERREELEVLLQGLQKKYYRFRYQQLALSCWQVGDGLAAKITLGEERLKTITELQARLAALEKTASWSQTWRELQIKQVGLRNHLSELTREQTLAQAAEEIGHLKRGEGEIALLKQRRQELIEELKLAQTQFSQFNLEIEHGRKQLQSKLEEQVKLVDWFVGLAKGGGSWAESELTKLISEQRELKQHLLSVKSLTEVKTLANQAGAIAERLQILAKHWSEDAASQSPDWDSCWQQRDHLAQEIGGLEANLNQQAIQLSAKQESSERLQASLFKIEASLESKAPVKVKSGETEELGSTIKQVEQELTMIDEKLQELHNQEESSKSDLFKLQRELDRAQNLAQTYSQEKHELELAKARLETKLEDLEREMVQEAPLELIHEIKAAGETETIAEGATALEIKKLKGQLELTGGIEPEVVSDYEQTKTRFDFLTGQITDLEQATQALEAIIQDLDETIAQRFLVSFRAINEKFVEYFKLLFSGGKVQLVLQKIEPSLEEEAGSETTADGQAEVEAKPLSVREKFLAKEKIKAGLFAGVEIQATPPGKKLATIASLSGGEKALASIALICAIISFNPSPFVVLDEVDAALDESNSERFAAILDKLMVHTQFITITHNRATMRRAAVLYGVTMGDDGISKLLSVKLEEAKEMAGKKLNPKT